MLGTLLASPVLIFDSTVGCSSHVRRETASYGRLLAANGNLKFLTPENAASPFRRNCKFNSGAREIVVAEEDKEAWESCKQAISSYVAEIEEQEIVLGKAFGVIHSPYWGEERKQENPNLDSVAQILNYLEGLGLAQDDLRKVLKKFPEVLGCSLEDELKANVLILEKQWGIQGKALRNLLVRNPKVLGYKIDCEGDCQALCTRCWARF